MLKRSARPQRRVKGRAALLAGVGNDAAFIAEHIAAR
jgi:hypothetical protein